MATNRFSPEKGEKNLCTLWSPRPFSNYQNGVLTTHGQTRKISVKLRLLVAMAPLTNSLGLLKKSEQSAASWTNILFP